MKTQHFPHMTVLPGKLPLALLVAQACCLPALATPADSKSGGEQTLAPVVVYAMPGGNNAGGSSKGRNTNLMPGGNFYDNDDYKNTDYSLSTGFAKSIDGGVRQDIDYGLKLRYGTSDFDSENITPTTRTKGSYFAVEKSKRFQGEIRAADRISFGTSGISVTPSVSLTHARISHDGKLPDYHKTAPSGGLRLEYQPNDNHLISADYHRATRIPRLHRTGQHPLQQPRLPVETGNRRRL